MSSYLLQYACYRSIVAGSVFPHSTLVIKRCNSSNVAVRKGLLFKDETNLSVRYDTQYQGI